MYQPGLDRKLAEVRYAEVLEQSADARLHQQAEPAKAAVNAIRLVLALIVVTPVVFFVARIFVAG